MATNSSSIESTLAWLSAARYSIVLYGSLHLPAILPHSPRLYAVLRQAHIILAYLFFITFMAHVGAILFHTLIVKDGLLKRMALGTSVLPQAQELVEGSGIRIRSGRDGENF